MAVKKDNGGSEAGQAPKLTWDDSRMQSSYANVCNVASTPEEVTLLFGTNTVWHSGQQEISVQLSNRVILNPHAAKRLSLLLGKVMAEYEKRFGQLEMAADPQASIPTK